ncbi:MAG: hypothetical protein Kow00121_60240 [Elainellaceae cyanobacterium]
MNDGLRLVGKMKRKDSKGFVFLEAVNYRYGKPVLISLKAPKKAMEGTVEILPD